MHITSFMKPIGTLEVKGQALYVTDPCRGPTSDCSFVIKNILPGTWKASIIEGHDKDWGDRIAALLLFHESVRSPARTFNPGASDRVWWSISKATIGPEKGKDKLWITSKWAGRLGTVRVDSGMAGFFPMPEYRKACEQRKECFFVGRDINVEPFGVWVQSGYGDGMYPCHGLKRDRFYVGLFLEFICSFDVLLERGVVKNVPRKDLPTLIGLLEHEDNQALLEKLLKGKTE